MTKTNTENIRVARILITVSDDALTEHGKCTKEEGWGDITESLRRFLARFPLTRWSTDHAEASLLEWEAGHKDLAPKGNEDIITGAIP